MNSRIQRAARCGVGVALALMAATALPSRAVHAADPPPKNALDPQMISGTVVKLDAGDVVIDLGAKKGAADGDVLELWRPITVKHPVTGKMLTDRFRIGAIKLTQVGEVMSLGKPQGTLLRPVESGDVVLLPRPAKIAAPVPTPTPKTGATTTSTSATAGTAKELPLDADPEARALSALFDGLTGQPIEVRIERYEAWAAAHPSSRFVAVLIEEAGHLRALLAAPSDGGAAAVVQAAARSFQQPKEVLAGSSFDLGVEITGPCVGAVLHLRLADEPAFTPMAMLPAGPGYFSVRLPRERVVGPTLSYFIEAVAPGGGAVAVVASSSSPNEIKVLAAPTVKPLQTYESTFSLWTDYADYNRLRGNDYAWQTEGYFGMRFSDVGVRAVRSGFGVYKGKGGGLTDLDQLGLKPRTVGLSYGYIEGEFGLTATFSLIARAIVGLGEDGVTGGGQGFIRIGSDKKTNFMIGGEFLGGIGVRGITQVELNMFPRVPILLRSEVTNQPAGTTPSPDPEHIQDLVGKSVASSDLGVRAIVQAGYRVTPNLTFFLRASYQGRTINHAGPGGGAGMTFSW